MANYNLKIIDNKVIFDGHAENPSDCHTLTLLCNLLQNNTKTIDYRAGYAEFELDDIPSENKFLLNYLQTFYINDTLIEVHVQQSLSDAFIGGNTLSISLSFSQDGVTVHNTGSLACKVGLVSDLDLDSYFSVTSVSSISAGETALLPFLDNIKLRSILSSDGQEISEGDVISDNGTKLTVSKIKSVDLTTLPGWSSLSAGSHNITIVAKADGYRDSEKSAAVIVNKPAATVTLDEGTYKFLESPVILGKVIEQDLNGAFNSMTKVGNTWHLTTGQLFNSISLGRNGATYDLTIFGTSGEVNLIYRDSTKKWIPVHNNVEYSSAPVSYYDSFRTITLSTAQQVSAEFYKWAITDGNLVKQVQPTGETWLLNNVLNESSLTFFNINFVSNNVSYTGIARDYNPGEDFDDLIYSAGNTSSDNYTAYDYGTWTNQADRTLTFSTPPTGELLNWLQANGIKQ